MKIVSLLPSATEIVYALGLEEHLAGVTAECDFPPAARSKPVISTSAIATDEPPTPAEIDAAVRDHMDAERPIYALDAGRIRDIQPDLILAQDLCRVCAVPSGQVEEALNALGCTARVLSLDPFSIEEVIDGIEEVARATGTDDRAAAIVGNLRDRIERVEARARDLEPVRTFCLEWLDPPFTGGHWVPGMVEMAGGLSLLNGPRERSRVVAWDAIRAERPDVVVFMPCGFGLREAAAQGRELPDRLPGARVLAVDASAYFSRPGPRVVDGLEILAWALHPDVFDEPPPGRVAELAGPVERPGADR